MDSATENTALLREAYTLWHDSRGGSVEHWMGLFAENVSFGSVAGGATAALPFSSLYDNRRAVAGISNCCCGIGR